MTRETFERIRDSVRAFLIREMQGRPDREFLLYGWATKDKAERVS